MPRSRNKDERRNASSTATLPEEPVLDNEEPIEEERIPDVLVRVNYRLLWPTLGAAVLCLAVLFLAHRFQLQRNASKLKGLADAAESEGNDDAAITHLTRYLKLQREQHASSEDEEQTATLVRLANLLIDRAESTPDLQKAYPHWQNAFNYLEEVLRNHPERHKERTQLVDVSVEIYRYRDALAHLAALFESQPGAASDTNLLAQAALSHASLGETVEAQQSYCRLIDADPGDCEPYVALARLIAAEPDDLWFRDPDKGTEGETSSIERVFPSQKQAAEQGRSPQTALKTVGRILDELAQRGQPAWDAHRRRAQFLYALPSSLDAPKYDEAGIPPRVTRLMEEVDENRDGLLNEDELPSAAIPAFSDIDHNGSITKDELTDVLARGGHQRRLDEAEASISKSLTLADQDGSSNAKAESLRTAADVYFALAHHWQYEADGTDIPQQKFQTYVGLTKDAVAQAAALSDQSPENLLAEAQMELNLAGFEETVDERQQRVDRAETLLRRARKELNSPGESAAEQSTDTELTLTEVEVTLGDVLAFQLQSSSEEREEKFQKQLGKDIIPSLKKHERAAHWAHFFQGELHLAKKEWLQAEQEFRAAAAEASSRTNSDFLRRVGLRRSYCAQRLADAESRVARALSVHQADPTWAPAQIALAEAYDDAGNVDAAIAEYGPYGGLPEITPRYARLAIAQQRRKPATDRKWSFVERVIELLKTQEENAEQVPAIESDLLVLQAATLQLAHQNAEGAGFAEAAKEKLDQADETLRQAIDKFPENVEIRAALSNLTAERFDLPIPDRIKQCQDVLQLAREQLGDSIPLRLAAANASRLLPEEDALAVLKEQHAENAEFTPQQRAALLSRLATFYAGRGRNNLAIQDAVEAARLVPADIAYPQAALTLMIGHVLNNNGDIGEQRSHWDAMLEQLATIEGNNGPWSAYYEGAMLVLATAAESDGTDRDDLQQRLARAHQLLLSAQQKRPRASQIPRMLGELETLRHTIARQNGDGDAQRFQEAAVVHFERAVELEDYSETVAGRLVEYYALHHRQRDAKRLLDQVARVRPDVISGQLATLAWTIENQLNEGNLAVEAYVDRAGGPGSDAADKIRAAIMKMTHGSNGPEVEKLLLQARELEPQSPGPWEWLVRYYALQGRFVAANDQIDEAAQALPDDPPSLKPRTIARCYRALRRNDTQEQKKWGDLAQQHYLAAIEADPTNMDLKRELAEYYTEAGQLDAARETLASIVDPQSGASPQLRDWAITHQALIAEDPVTGLKRLQEATPADDQGKVRNLRAQLAYFTTLNRASDRPDMLEALEKLRELTAGNLTQRERFQFATILQEQGNWKRAHEVYVEWLDSDPDDTAALAPFAASLIRHRDDDANALVRARTHWETLNRLEPNAYRTHALEARLLAAEGRPEEAAASLSTFVLEFADVTVEDVFTKIREATSAEQAIKLLRSADHLTADPTIAAELKKAQGLQDKDQSDEALNILKRLANAQQTVVGLRAESIKNAAQLIEGIGRPRKAEALYEEYARRSSQPEAPLELARFLGRQMRFDEALEICRDHWDDIPAETVGSLAAALLRTQGAPDSGAVTEFVHKLKASVDSAPNDRAKRDRLFELANLYDLQQDYDGVEAVYSQIIKLNPDDVATANNLAFIWARRGKNLPQALELINQQIAELGQSAELLDTQAIVLLAAGKAEEAVAILSAICEQIPAPLFFLHLAEAQAAAGQQAASQKSLQAAVDKGLEATSLHPFDLAAYQRLKRD